VPAVDRFVAADHSAAVDHCAEVGRDAAADRCVAALHIGAFHGVAQVEIHAAPNVVQSVAPNAVRKFSWGVLIESPVALAVVPARVVVRVVTQASA
jgi:hypothetical protein